MACYQCWSLDKCVFYRLVCTLLKIITPLGISGSRYGRKLKLSPKKLLDKRWILVMSSFGLCDKRAFLQTRKLICNFCYYRRSIYADGSFLCQVILKQKLWCLIYYFCWSRDKWVFYRLVCQLLKTITPWYLRSQT